MTSCATCPPRPDPAIPRTPGAQAAYMARMADVIEAHGHDDVPVKVLVDICHALAVIGYAVARADEAYIRGLADGAKGRRVAGETASPVLKLSMRGRRWRVRQDSGDTFEDDDDFDGLTLTIELRSPEEARDAAMLMMDSVGSRQPSGPGPEAP